MSSSQIYAQICSTKAQIETVKQEITKLEILLEKQDAAIRKYAIQATAYTDRFERQYGIYKKISEHTQRSVLAQNYNERLSEDMSQSRRSAAYDSVETISCLMNEERNRTYEDLEAKRRELAALQSKLNQLNTAYQNALRAEEEARRRAAEAASAANQRRDK